MARIEKSVVINASPERIFTFVDEIEKMSQWMDGAKEVKATSKESRGPGTTSHWVIDSGRTRLEWDAETTEWVENEKVGWRTASGNLSAFGTNTVKPTAAGSEFRMVIQYELPYSILGRIIDKLKVSKEMGESVERSLGNLKKLVEE